MTELNKNHFYPTKYWSKLSDGRVRCELCPRLCTLRPEKRGTCFIRMHHDDEIVLTSFGKSSGFCVDPIEKKPLNHFYPGTRVLSFGTAGCNLTCKFCQNWDISKSRETERLSQVASPDEIVDLALKYDCKSIAFTYNDPVVFLEYAIEVAKLARQQNIKCVAVTAGYICEKPRIEFFSYMDATNIDLKGFSQDFYQSLCHGELETVLETLNYVKHCTDCHLEITNLLIPNQNDSDEELHKMSEWLNDNLGQDVPLHFTAFHPDFKMLDTPRTPKTTLIRAKEIASSYGHNYVYIGNVHDKTHENTYCPHCHKLVIERDWYTIGHYQLNDSGQCLHCGHQIYGQFCAFIAPFGARRIPVRPSH